MHHYCYLLSNKNHTYIGYTTDPKRRLKQHNGILKGGGKYTRRYRPWKLKIIIKGFKNGKQARQFEYAWKHPSKSRFLKNVKGRSLPRDKLCYLLGNLDFFKNIKIIKK